MQVLKYTAVFFAVVTFNITLSFTSFSLNICQENEMYKIKKVRESVTSLLEISSELYQRISEEKEFDEFEYKGTESDTLIGFIKACVNKLNKKNRFLSLAGILEKLQENIQTLNESRSRFDILKSDFHKQRSFISDSLNKLSVHNDLSKDKKGITDSNKEVIKILKRYLANYHELLNDHDEILYHQNRQILFVLNEQFTDRLYRSYNEIKVMIEVESARLKERSHYGLLWRKRIK